MSMCAVNGREWEAPVGLKTWGQLLEALEQGAGAERAVVTAVRFRGVDQPSFREPVLLAQDLAAGAPIDVDTCRAHALVAEAVETALNGLDPLAQAAQQTADAFRCHDLAEAHSGLEAVVGTLQALTRLTALAGQAGVAPRTARADHDHATLTERLGQSLEALITAETNEDWVSVADVLEYDVADLLPGWEAVLRDLAHPESETDAGRGLPVGLRCAS
jgi:hypothetical protein